MRAARTLSRLAILLAGVTLAVAVGWGLFLAVPETLTELLGVVLTLVTGLLGARFAGNLAGRLFPEHTVAEVAVEGPITRDGGGDLFSPPVGARADEIVEQIDRADGDSSAEALLVKLNTPGGEIVPSEDIRLAAERFDGPTVAYATDVCASGGYDIASGCDELWAREGSIVGSIGVIGSRVTVADLADRLGVSYEQFTAGRYKDAGTPLREPTDEEREYLQGIVDGYYDDFVETVAENRDIDESAVRATEARVYLGADAADLGLIDHLGTRRDVESALEDHIEGPVVIEEFSPERGLTERLRGGAQRIVFALGIGLGRAVSGDVDGVSFRR